MKGFLVAKKKNEIFQMAMLEPSLAILDETDSGLDIDALRIVANGVNKIKNSKCYCNYSLPKITRPYYSRLCSCFYKMVKLLNLVTKDLALSLKKKVMIGFKN